MKYSMNIIKKVPSKVRKHLSADALFSTVHESFGKIVDHRTNATIPLADALMSAFAVFSLKDPSLLAFDERRRSGDPNLYSIYKIGSVPCDSRMREIVDKVDPNDLGDSFKNIWR